MRFPENGSIRKLSVFEVNLFLIMKFRTSLCSVYLKERKNKDLQPSCCEFLRMRSLNLSNSLLKLEQKIYDRRTRFFDTLLLYLDFAALL
jgi:hypothetical protein